MLSWSRAVLACLIVGGVQVRAAEVSRIELLPLQSVTVTEEQFLTGSRDGRPVTIASLAAQNSSENGSLLPPNAPPTGGWMTRMRAGERPRTCASSRCR